MTETPSEAYRRALRDAAEALIAKGKAAKNGTRARVDYIRGAIVVQGLYFRASDEEALRRRSQGTKQ